MDLAGLIVGPVVMSLVLAALRIYEARRRESPDDRSTGDRTMVPYRAPPSAHYALDHVLSRQYQTIFRRLRRGRGGGTTHGAG